MPRHPPDRHGKCVELYRRGAALCPNSVAGVAHLNALRQSGAFGAQAATSSTLRVPTLQGSTEPVHPAHCPRITFPGTELKKLRLGKRLVPEVRICEQRFRGQQLYGREGRVDVPRFHPLLGSSSPAGLAVLDCNFNVQSLHRAVCTSAFNTATSADACAERKPCEDDASSAGALQLSAGSASAHHTVGDDLGLSGGAPHDPFAEDFDGYSCEEDCVDLLDGGHEVAQFLESLEKDALALDRDVGAEGQRTQP